MVFSPKIDSLLEEFSGELAHINLIPPGIDEADFDPEEDIRLVEKLLYDDSSPRPPKELNFEISDAIIESFSHLLSPLRIMTILWRRSIYSLLWMTRYHRSFHFDRYYVPSSPRPPEKPPDDDGIYFDIEPDMGVLTTKVFNPGILASKEKKSPHFLSHRGFKAFQIIHNFSKSPTMICGEDIPILDVPFLHFYPP
nr:hypothetical protein [Tanacetum cinerariifolium]